ncbi:hypothetical protein FJTKL_08420 [Diaporthe vaccinii]|uniref:Uncharacterized protein n=1 Tax=Diaporthe vaccinii TaxID=105482 RepID=A0ABR4ERY7_9PEZI
MTALPRINRISSMHKIEILGTDTCARFGCLILASKPSDFSFSLFIKILSLKVVFSITTFCGREPGSHHRMAGSRRWCSLWAMTNPRQMECCPAIAVKFVPRFRATGKRILASYTTSSLLLGQRGESQVWLDDAEVGEQLLGLLVLDGRVDNDVVARNPVDRGGDLVLVTGLERVDDAQDLGAVTAGRGGVRQDGADSLLGVDEEDGANGEGNALLIDVGSVLIVKPKTRGRVDSHVIKVGDLPLLVGNNGEVEGVAADLLDVGSPALVRIDGIGAQAQQLDAALLELGLEAGHLAQLGGADRGVVLGVGEEDNPVLADILVQVDGALGRIGLEVGGNGAQTEAGGDSMLAASSTSARTSRRMWVEAVQARRMGRQGGRR